MKRGYICLFSLALIFTIVAAANAAEIHEAAKSGDIEKLKTLLQQNPGLLYLKDENGKTPLHWATGRGQVEAAKYLISIGVNINVRNNNNGTPLHVAASQGQPEIAKILIENGAAVNARTKDGATPLHFAAFKSKPEHLEVLRVLLDYKADVNAKMNNGATPLSMALFRGNTEAANILRQHGAKESAATGSRMLQRQRGLSED